jgi:hypothetical protein
MSKANGQIGTKENVSLAAKQHNVTVSFSGKNGIAYVKGNEANVKRFIAVRSFLGKPANGNFSLKASQN